MLSATGSTGRRKGEASFTFFKLRMVDWQKRNCALLRVDGGGVGGGIGVPAIETAAEAGGGVADFRRTAHKDMHN
jgi:hypothetical protein